MSLEQWESYYKTGALAAFPTAPDGGYDLEVKKAWVEFFSTLPDAASILDVGTGNGIIASIAVEAASALGFDWTIHATDLAKIDPRANVPDGARRFGSVSFHPGVASEKLPFSAAEFDAVTGSFALEYCNSEQALSEIHRVLKQGGAAQFLIHAADSALVAAARAALSEADLVLTKTKIYRRVHRLVTIDRFNPVTTQKSADDLRSAIRELKEALASAKRTGGGRVLEVTLDAVQKLLAGRTQAEPHQVGREVDRAEAEMRASVRRMNDLIAHAQTVADMAVIEAQAAAAGFTMIERTPQYHAGSNLVGWLLLLHRP